MSAAPAVALPCVESIADRAMVAPRYTSYPPATAFGPQTDRLAKSELARLGKERAPLSLYVHVPFCRSLCWYCGCNVTISRNADRGDAYVDTTATEMVRVAEALGAPAPVTEVSLGGGSPNFLRPDALTKLATAIGRYFTVTPDARRSIELDPRATTPEQIDALAAAGWNPVSIGVQDFDLAVQEIIGRHQSVAETTALVKAVRAARVDDLNMDLIYGLPRQTEASMAVTLDEVIALAPDRNRAVRLRPRAVDAVGGDFFNVVAVDETTLSFFIGDGSDKGVPAALFMARLVTLLDGPLRRGDSPGEVLARVGRRIAMDNPADMYATCLVGRVDLAAGQLRLASAGHEAPLLMHAQGDLELVGIDGGPALGIEVDADYPEVSLKLHQGDVLLLFTGGLIEATELDGEMFGAERLHEVLGGLRSRSAHQVVMAMAQVVHQFQADKPPNDDLCMLCLRMPPELSGQVVQDGDLLQSHGLGILPALLDAMERRLRFLGFRQNTRDDARLVAEEIFTNACLHGQRGPAEVTCDIRSMPYEDGLFLELMDDGSPFDPLAQNLPDVDADLDEREVGGLGVFLVRTLSSEANYHRAGEHNILQLVLSAGRKPKGA